MLGKDERPPNQAFMESMPYTQSLLANGVAKGYHAKAAPPTVTMPRLKVSVSSFLIIVAKMVCRMPAVYGPYLFAYDCRRSYLVLSEDSLMWLSISTLKFYLMTIFLVN